MQFKADSQIYSDLASNGYRVRGYFINEIIVLERLMDNYISRYFTNDNKKALELKELILCTKRIGFEGKRQILKYIMDNHDSIFKNKYPDLPKDLKNLEDLRNTLAHCILDTRSEAMELTSRGIISFITMLNDTIEISYTQEEINEFKNKISFYQNAFVENEQSNN